MTTEGDYIAGAQPVEYAEESSYASYLPDDTSYNWFGIGTSWSVDSGVESESITYLPEYNASNKLEKNVNVAHREMWEGEITFHPQNDFPLLDFFTGADGGTSDTIPPIQVGHINEGSDLTEFQRLAGGAGEEVTVSVGEDETVEVSGSFIFADAEEFDNVDYITDGIQDLSSNVTPSSDEVSVQTSSIDNGTVILYDGNGNQLDTVPANSSSAKDSSEVSGTSVASVYLLSTDSYSGETISVYPETGGTGTAETADVSKDGSHATEDTTEPHKYADLSNVEWGGTALDDAVESLEFTISNSLEVVRDPDANTDTLIDAIVPVDREITVDLTLTYAGFDMMQEVRSYNAKDLTFDIGNTSFTITNVQFPEFSFELSPDDLISDSVSSDRADSISWS